MKLKDLHPRRFFIETWRELDDEATDYRFAHKDERGGLGKAVYIFVVVAVSLTLHRSTGAARTRSTRSSGSSTIP